MDVLTRPAEEFGNDETLEHLWAARAMEHSDIYFNVLCSVDTRWLRLTPHDDLIYTHFKQDFPDLKVSFIKEDEIKNNINKVKWRIYCDKFKNIVEDYSFGTLLRADTKGDYSEQNTILVPRVQFYAIEIARNREGLNNEVKKKYKCASKATMEAQMQHRESLSVMYGFLVLFPGTMICEIHLLKCEWHCEFFAKGGGHALKVPSRKNTRRPYMTKRLWL